MNCGVYVTLVLCCLLVGREAPEEVGDPNKYREEYIAEIWEKVRRQKVNMVKYV